MKIRNIISRWIKDKSWNILKPETPDAISQGAKPVALHNGHGVYRQLSWGTVFNAIHKLEYREHS